MVLQALLSHPDTLNLLLLVWLSANGKLNVMVAIRSYMSNQRLDMNWTTAVRPMFLNARINGLRKNARNVRRTKNARRTVKRLVIVAMIALLHLITNSHC